MSNDSTGRPRANSAPASIAILVIGLMAVACSSASTPPSSAPTAVPEAFVLKTPSTPTPAVETVAPPLAAETAEQALEYCAPVESDTLQNIQSTPASPYFVYHPKIDNPMNPTVIFLPGGSGRQRSAERVWPRFLANGKGVENFRVVIPYAVDVDFSDEARRTYKALDEILECYGGDPAKVHLAGFSNGGHAAFFLMLVRPHLFATLLGAPGEFPTMQPTRWAEALKDRPVFNGVGSNDLDWLPGVKATHEELVEVGVDSVYVEFEGEGQSLSEEFDESIYFEFWLSH